MMVVYNCYMDYRGPTAPFDALTPPSHSLGCICLALGGRSRATPRSARPVRWAAAGRRRSAVASSRWRRPPCPSAARAGCAVRAQMAPVVHLPPQPLHAPCAEARSECCAVGLCSRVGLSQSAVHLPGCAVESCSFTQLGAWGLALSAGTSRSAVRGCSFSDLSGGAVYVGNVNETRLHSPKMVNITVVRTDAPAAFHRKPFGCILYPAGGVIWSGHRTAGRQRGRERRGGVSGILRPPPLRWDRLLYRAQQAQRHRL